MLDSHVILEEKPLAAETYMIAGWQQWADAGSISSRLPNYLIELTDARKIGLIEASSFYLFQFPGTHHLLRPEIKLEDGYRVELRKPKNELFYSGNEQKGLVIFAGHEPHLNVDAYATAFFDVAEALNVRRIGVVGGVYGAMPYDKDREISCVYSLPAMQADLSRYAVRFSGYEGGATIGAYMLEEAERRGLEYFVFYAFVPAYDLSKESVQLQGMRIENDFKAWYDLTRRFNHMYSLGLDLAELEEYSRELVNSMTEKVDALIEKFPQLNIRDYLNDIAADFTERPFEPLSDVWEKELGDLLEDLDD